MALDEKVLKQKLEKLKNHPIDYTRNLIQETLSVHVTNERKTYSHHCEGELRIICGDVECTITKTADNNDPTTISIKTEAQHFQMPDGSYEDEIKFTVLGGMERGDIADVFDQISARLRQMKWNKFD